MRAPTSFMNGQTVSATVSLDVNVASAPLDTLPAHSTYALPVDPAKPYLVALAEAVEAARQQSNAVLTAWKAEIGDREKALEKRAQEEHEAAKRANLKGHEEDDSDEDGGA